MKNLIKIPMLNATRFLLMALLCMFISVACSTPQKAKLPEIPITPALDYQELQNRLGIELNPNETGYREKGFDACYLEGELSNLKDPPSNCHHAFFSVIQFQLSCRASEESASVLSASDLTPVSEQSIKWVIGKSSGEGKTDFQGRGVIRIISNKSLKKSFMRLSTGFDFLNMRTEQATEIVTPPSWCERH